MARISLRLNEDEDKDLIDALENAKNKSKEIKKLMRRGLGVVQQPTQDLDVLSKTSVKKTPPEPEPEEHIEQVVIDVSDEELLEIERNIMDSFGF